MKISLIHPSRSRPQQAAATRKAWKSSAKDKDKLEYIMSIDHDDPYRDEYFNLSDGYGLFNRKNKSAIEAINYAATLATGDLLVVVSDDFSTPPYHWDEALRTALAGQKDFVAKTDDTLQPFIITLPILDRAWYERHGYVYHPDYKHMYSDSHMSCEAWLAGKYIKLPIRIPHNHYSTGKTPKDQVNMKADSTYASGKYTFMQHYANNFGVENIVWPLTPETGFYNFK